MVTARNAMLSLILILAPLLCLRAEDAELPVEIAPNDSKVRYMGRFDMRDAIRMTALFASHPEFFQPPEHDVEAPVRQRLGMGDEAGTSDWIHRRTACVVRLEARSEQHHADDAIAGKRILHHRAIARLEDVQWQKDVGEEDDIREREDRDGCW